MTQATESPELPRQTSTADRTVTVLLMIGLGILVPIVAFLGLLFGMVSDGCGGDAACDGDQIGLGILIASGSPIVVFIAALSVVVKRFRRRLPTWWVPLVALAAGAVLFIIGGIVAATGAS
jgi:hypothetical protein